MDVIITGRGIDEREVVENFVFRNWSSGARIPRIFLNPVTKSMGRTREDSGRHKARTLRILLEDGQKFGCMFEDDPIQFQIIEEEILRMLNEGFKDVPRLAHINSWWTKK